MRNYIFAAAGVAMMLFAAPALTRAKPATTPSRPLPVFEPDPNWPKWPASFKAPFVSGVFIDSHDNAWLATRPRRAQGSEQQTLHPPVMEFDPQGNYVKGWGGPAYGYEWPQSEHSVYIDYKGFLWISGDQRKTPQYPFDDDQILKFTQDGKFVMQMGHNAASKGDNDTENFNRPPNVQVNPKTNELFVADGYGNHRIAVFDAGTGKFKRMWGAFGKPPTGPEQNREPTTFEGDGQPYFSTPHVLLLSHDDLLYVADRGNRRIQVFSLDGKFIRQLARYDQPFARNLAFSPDPDQSFIYTGYGKGIAVIDRKSMEYAGMIQSPGLEVPGHQIATDSEGNLYLTGAILPGKSGTAGTATPGKVDAIRLIYKGMSNGGR